MKTKGKKKSWFIVLAHRTAGLAGSPYVFLAATAIILLWGISGPIFHYSDTWQLVINTSTTIITFLMVFLIQNTQNRDSKAVQLKLDELIRAMKGAHTVLLDMEEMSEEELDAMRRKYATIAQIARKRIRAGKRDTNIPQIILDKPIALK